MFKIKILAILTIFLLANSLLADGLPSQEEQMKVNKVYNKTILMFMAQDKKIKKLVNRSFVYIAFPSIKKGGLIFGYARGEGRAYNHGKWIGNVTISQYSFGLTAGGQAYSQMIFFKTPADFDKFKESGLIAGTQASAVGIKASASGGANINENVQVFTSDGAGLMLEASFAAQDFIYEAI